MAYQEVTSLDADNVISLGGTNRKTNTKNPNRVEGFYLGTKTVKDAKKKSGESYIHIFKTAKGNVGVWGKTDMDRKLSGAPLGAMTRVTFDKMRPTPNGDMYVYKVEVDSDNTIEVVGQTASIESADEGSEEGYEASGDDDGADYGGETEEEEEAYEPPTPAPRAANPAQKARVDALLKKSKGA
jgi:hypothetical protein